MTLEQAQQLAVQLIQQGYADERAIRDALEEFKAKPEPQFTHILYRRGDMTLQLHGKVLSRVSRAPFVDLTTHKPQRDALDRLSAELAYRHHAIPINASPTGLTVAFADPTDKTAYNAVSAAIGEPVQAAVADQAAIEEALRTYYASRLSTGPPPVSTSAAAADTADAGPEPQFEFTAEELQAMQTDDVNRVREFIDQGPTVLLVNMMLMKAMGCKASDIHVEPYEQNTVVRFRVDGTLYDWRTIPAQAHSHMVARVKVISNLDTTERFVPQDGRFNAKEFVGRDLDLRVSILPTYYGEKIVMRLLDKTAARRPLAQLGMTQDDLDVFERMIRRPWGMVILTGPTGSGKTTTLYAALDRIRTVQKNIMTIEDPVEYQIDRIIQVQINERQGRTFPLVLRSALRQDPDIIMVGEIRDEETAELAVRAALTGHLVMSTLHTNDAPGAIPRIVDMGVEPYLVASSIHGVVAQRLVRRICKNCAVPYTPEHELLVWAHLHDHDLSDWKLQRGLGCERCNQTGYSGRVGIYEMMPVTDEIRDLAVDGAGATKIRVVAVEQGMHPLRDQAMALVADGTTTLDEMVAATAL
jgi:type IV pilus assembly protein PilB